MENTKKRLKEDRPKGFVVTGCSINNGNGDIIPVVPVFAETEDAAQAVLKKLYMDELKDLGLEDNNACDENDESCPGGCLSGREADIWNHTQYAYGLVNVAHFSYFPLEPLKGSTGSDTHTSGEKTGLANMRTIANRTITPDVLKTAINEENLDGLLHLFDEIDIPLDTGGTVTAVCAYVEPEWARFVFKDCWNRNVMNDEANIAGAGYFKSKGRARVLVDILPHITQEWRAIFKPRKMVEVIHGERVEYEDLMWLPSATDVFGPSENGEWKDIDGSFQLPIFKQERDRAKRYGKNRTTPYWLRSVCTTDSSRFFYVYPGVCTHSTCQDFSLGFAPGFDI